MKSVMRYRPCQCVAFLVLGITVAATSAAWGAAEPAGPLAFPTAEGFARFATGGRGGEIVRVTNLDNDGPGSFRAAVSASHRTVVFDVGGTIHLQSVVSVPSDITIAGQTAPGEGIALLGQEVSFSKSKNDIVRFIRFRQGMTGATHKSTINMTGSEQMMFDHVSVEWGRWDNLDMANSKDITFQYCIIGQGINPQRFGCLCESDNVTFIHNLWIDNKSRNPKAKGRIQFINNVVYNWGVGGFVGGHSAADHYADVVNNYFIRGPESGERVASEFTATDKVYQSGNVADMDRDGTLNGKPVAVDGFHGASVMEHPFSPLADGLDTAEQACRKVLAGAGCSLHRDSVDQALVADAMSFGKGGKIIEDPKELGATGEITSSNAPAAVDGNGVPMAWRATHPAKADVGKGQPSDFERYLADLAGDFTER